MANYHYVDPKDQHEAAEGIADHSELTTFYAEAKKEVLGPWMQEADRQKAMEEDRYRVILGLRKSAALVGVHISLPIVVGIIVYQLLTNIVTPENAIMILFIILIGLGIYVLIAISLFKWVLQKFYMHNLRPAPIVLTTIASISLLIQPLFRITDAGIGGLIGYGVGLVALLLTGTALTTLAILVWTSRKVSGVLKIIFLLCLIGLSAAALLLL